METHHQKQLYICMVAGNKHTKEAGVGDIQGGGKWQGEAL